MKKYDFPNATLKVYPDRTCREFPKWCLCISVARPRNYVAEALKIKREIAREHGKLDSLGELFHD